MKKTTLLKGVSSAFIGYAVALLLRKKQRYEAGNKEEYGVKYTKALPESKLTGKRIIFLGSSVTYGAASKGESFVEYLQQRDKIIPYKEAVSGTTLVDEPMRGKESYITRMKRLNPNLQVDGFVCQLSTNDATTKKPMGQISNSFDLESFDTKTIIGAMEYIIAYARNTWKCPVIFYTGTRYNSPQYEEMVKALLQLQKKWEIGVIDLWNDAQMNQVTKEEYEVYMVDPIHPSRLGYKEWWTPKFEERLKELL